MSTVGANPSSNGRAPEGWTSSWTHFRIDRPSTSYCRVTFEHPPINTVTGVTVIELTELIGLIENDPDLNVIVFDSANPAFYLTQLDLEHDAQRNAALGADLIGIPQWLDFLVRLPRAPVISIASIRGCVRGAGSQFVLACDLCFASRSNTLLGGFDLGAGGISQSGTLARLARLIGRGRALEILLVGEDLDGPRAEQYGYVTRLIADHELESEVDQIAGRLASIDHGVIARTKSTFGITSE